MEIDTLSIATLGALDSNGNFNTLAFATLGYKIEIDIEEVEAIIGSGGGSSTARRPNQYQNVEPEKISKIKIKLRKDGEFYEFTKYKKQVGIKLKDVNIDIIKIDNIVVDVNVIIKN